jgi:hypothetical protein
MKYWAYLVAKLVAAGGFVFGMVVAVRYYFFRPEVFMNDLFTRDLRIAFAELLITLIGAGLLAVIIWDQRYRCRTCLRRLRMPVQKGSWTHVLFGRPQTEYICPYGHGTLQVEELQITGRQEPDWQPHEDMWKELYSLEETKK